MSQDPRERALRGPPLPEPTERGRVMQRDPGTLFLESGEYVPAPAPAAGAPEEREPAWTPSVAPELLRPSSSHSSPHDPTGG